MALVGRIFVILFAFLVASLGAAMATAAGMMMPYDWSTLGSTGSTDIHQGLFTIAVAFGFFFISALALLPAVAFIAVAETFRLRSVLLYATAGGIEGLVLFYQKVVGSISGNDDLTIRMAEIAAAAGIAAGVIYWAIAGRNAGRWHERPSPPAMT